MWDFRDAYQLVEYVFWWRGQLEEVQKVNMHPDHLSYLRQAAYEYVCQARELALIHGTEGSWRRFGVGSVVLGFDGRYIFNAHRYRAYKSFNFKPFEGGHNYCAEIPACLQAIQEGCQEIVAIIVAGEPQEDHASGKTTLTLHPCGKCRKLLRAMKQVKDNTIIITARLHEEVFEFFTFAEVLAQHNSCEK